MMTSAIARLATRTLMLALVLGLAAVAIRPVAGVAQEVPAEAPDDEAPAGDPASPDPTAPVTIAPLPVASPQPGRTSASRGPLPSHDWRSAGYVALVGGRLYDPFCRPFRSVGSNVPNLMFREGLRENLEWMRDHQLRWLRVAATGHGHPRPVTQPSADLVARQLADLLGEVERFNAVHPPNESIYVMVALTDYYEPGVPGDQYGFDHAGWCNAKVLNAPWYRRGVTRYSFDQECGGGRLVDAPNYEVNFKPWVERIVAVGARSPALMGWQMGNELKSRDSDRNKIADAYDWYIDFQADIVDTIRRIDRNHLIFTGTQYLAELTDFPYRPNDGDPDLARLPGYAERFDRILRGCGQYCWNAWSLTDYDFHHYAIDDAIYLHKLGVGVVVTEYGFTLGSPDEEMARFGGDRRVALRSGRPQPWVDILGERHPYDWNTLDFVLETGLQGVAPWGSPAPSPSALPWYDLDSQRGISQAREGDELWSIWHDVSSRLEAANNAAGPDAACTTFSSE